MSSYVVKYGDTPHLALMFAKVNHGKLTIPYLGFMNSKKFPRNKAGNTKQMLMALTRYGLLRNDGMEWHLTPAGMSALRHVCSGTLRLREPSVV